MFEKVNPDHPDKVADRIAGAVTDIVYSHDRPGGFERTVATEVMVGHGHCIIIIETSDADLEKKEVAQAARRIIDHGNDVAVQVMIYKQDPALMKNQLKRLTPKCGDNGLFKGMPVTDEQRGLTDLAGRLYEKFPSDGKYLTSERGLVICQSNADRGVIHEITGWAPDTVINPLGYWTGGPDADTGCTNRKIGSDMGDAATGGGLHGKDLSKADVTLNIYAHLKAQETGEPVELSCAIGDDTIDGKPYEELVDIARDYIKGIGGFEKFAEWGLIRPND